MILTPEKLIPRNKRNIKSLATFPPRKDTITDQDKNTLEIQKYQCLPQHVSPFTPGFKSLRNEVSYDNTETTDTPRTGQDDTPRTNRYDYI